MAVAKTKKKVVKKQPLYKLEMVFNGFSFKKRTDNIEEAILSFKPDVLYTDVYVIVTNKKEIIERKLNLIQGKRLFLNENIRAVFINNLLLN